MRRKFIGGNWKMVGSRASVAALSSGLSAELADYSDVDIAVFPPSVFLQQVSEQLSDTGILVGAQNVSFEESGAFTGEISTGMLSDFQCHAVLCGHSERRQLYGEDDATVAKKCARVAAAGMKPVFCVGETFEEREDGQIQQVITRQLKAVFDLAPEAKILETAVIAYEPVWAIGTGLIAEPDDVQAVHEGIRRLIAAENKELSERIQIIYGGSVKPENAAAIFAMPDIDGALVGGASLNAEDFARICKT